MSVSLDRLAVFRTVVETGSFAAAARQLRQARAAVSFQIRQLEAELGVILLHRTTRSLALTAAGERFYARCLRVLTEAEHAIADARAEQVSLTGNLSIASTVEYGAAVVAPALAGFAMANPDLEVRFDAGSSNVDLRRDRIDVAIRLGREEVFRGMPYTGALLATYQLRPVAAPALADTVGVATPETVARLPHVANASVAEIRQWTMRDVAGERHAYDVPRPDRIVANSASVVKALAVAGAGVAFLPDWFVAEEMRMAVLVDMLPGYSFPSHSVYALHVPTPVVPRKIIAWIEHLRAAI